MVVFEDKKLKNLFKLDPIIRFPENVKVARINRVNSDSITIEDLDRIHRNLKNSLYKIPKEKYKIITIGRKGKLQYPQLKSDVKDEFLRKMERYINNTWNIRHRDSFFVYQDHIDEISLLGEMANENNNFITPVKNEELKKELAYFFGGDEDYPFGETLEEWEYGFKVGNKYAAALIQYRVSSEIVRFSNDYLNFIDADFIHVIHYEMMDSIKAEKKVQMSIHFAEKTNLPSEVINDLRNLYDKIVLKETDLVSFSQILFIFGNSKEEAINLAYQVKSKAPYHLAFEGDIEFEMPFIITDFDFLKGKELAGIVRFSTVDYISSLIPITKRYTGKPEGYFIPLLNEALEPAYIPINRDLFNAGVLGQMGAGKSVFLQYMATMFDMSIFIEKIQSDVGSYAVYCNYFDGDYVPLSLEVPVSINPLGKALSYFTVDIFSLMRTAGIRSPHKEFDENEREAMSLLLDDFVFSNRKEVLTKNDLVKLASTSDRTIRFKHIFNNLPDNFKWKVEYIVNSSRKVFVNTIISFMYKGTDKGILSEDKALIERMLDGFYNEQFKKDPYKEVFISEFCE